MKKFYAILMALILALSLAACAGKTEQPANGEDNTDTQTFKIGFACDDLSTDFAAAMAQGVTDKCEELGIELETADANKDANNQASQVENMITNGCQAIIMTPYDISACGPIGAACEEAGIPLIVLNTPLNEDTYFTTAIVMDIEEMATAKANAVVEALGGEGRVYMLMGPLAQEMWTTQADIAKKIFAENPGIEVIDEQTGNNKRDESIVVMENWISTGEAFDAVWCSNDASAIGAGTACAEAGIDAFIIGQGGQNEGAQAIKDGVFDWTIYAPGSLISSTGAAVAYMILSGESVEKTTYLELEDITPDNVDNYI